MLRYKRGVETTMKYYFISDVQRRLFGKNKLLLVLKAEEFTFMMKMENL